MKNIKNDVENYYEQYYCYIGSNNRYYESLEQKEWKSLINKYNEDLIAIEVNKLIEVDNKLKRRVNSQKLSTVVPKKKYKYVKFGTLFKRIGGKIKITNNYKWINTLNLNKDIKRNT